MRFDRFPTYLALLAVVCLATLPAFGQSLTTGSISGTVFDPAHAVVAGASVTLKGVDTGSSASATTSPSGAFNFNLLKPGRYQITVKGAGFAEMTQNVDVQVGEATKADVDLTVARGVETVEVSGTAPLINTEPSSVTAYTEQQVAQLPSAGGDITNIADTAPGVVVNGTGGYGNFTVNGMPATSNLFTVNGENDMDPYFNINNSGASNLTMGQNEIGEASVITNPYGGQYGQLAGAQVTYVTKSGTNTFHGNALYWWNGRYMNANDWMSNNSSSPRPFSNANQWATSIGGPIIKNKVFFFVDYEGLRFLLPNVDQVFAPSPQFITAAEANVANLNPAESSDYNKLLNFYMNAPGYAAAAANPASYNAPAAGDSCSTLVAPGFVQGSPCSLTYTATPKALAWEYILAPRVDIKLGNSDNLFVRYKLDHGLQPTSLDPINAAFDANSLQPSWDTQASETHVFNPNMANSFTATLSHYTAIFSAPTAAATFNYAQAFNEDSSIYNYTVPNNLAPDFPQGRNITQYQFIDDFSWTRGNHTFKFGENFRRYDISDHNFFYNSPRVYWGYTTNFLQSFADGVAYQYRKSLNQSSNVPVALWGMGGYAQDEWKANRNLKLTLALRLEHNSNPVCQTNCFANFNGPFSSTASYQAGLAGTGAEFDVPYSSDIKSGLHQAYHGVDSILFSPRLGFSWDVLGKGKTVLSGGIGLFYDNPAAGLVDNLLGNPPASVALRVRGNPSNAGVLPFDPNGAPLTWQQSASAFNINDSFNQISAALPAGVHFNPPAFGALVGTIHSPEWTEWNLSLQRQLDRHTVFIMNYAGNHGARISYSNAWPNAADGYAGDYLGNNGEVITGIFGGPEAVISGSFPTAAAAVPLLPPASNYANVTEFKSGGVSSYNGLTFSLARQFSHGVAGHLNYTWSHNLDETSNGGLFNYGFEGTNTILGQISPVNLRTSNYGNTDYDVRHLVNADFIVNPEFHYTGAIKWLVNGWQFSGKMFWRSGLPFTIVDGNLGGAVYNGGDSIPATIVGNAQPSGCGRGNAAFDLSKPGCLSGGGLADTSANVNTFNCFFFDPNPPVDCPVPTPLSAYPHQARNQYRGPHYFDMDLNLFKNFKIAERFNLAIGVQAFNAFNHPNFGLPNSTYFTGDPTFGGINTMQGTPTSPYGNFLGFDSSPRVVQLSGKLVF
jgi:hypothetical protein